MKGHLELYHAWMRESGATNSPEDSSGRLRRLSERSSTEDDAPWVMVDADSVVEGPVQVRPLHDVFPCKGGVATSSFSDIQSALVEAIDDDWEEIEPEQTSGSSEVCNRLCVFGVYDEYKLHTVMFCETV